MDSGEKVHSGFWRLCFWNWVVSEMPGAAYGLSKKLHAEFWVKITKVGIFGLSLDFFQGQVWPDLWSGMANVCYYCKLNNMLNV